MNAYGRDVLQPYMMKWPIYYIKLVVSIYAEKVAYTLVVLLNLYIRTKFYSLLNLSLQTCHLFGLGRFLLPCLMAEIL